MILLLLLLLGQTLHVDGFELLSKLQICLKYALKLNAAVHFLFVLEAPLTADIPLLGEELSPVTEEFLTFLQALAWIDNLECAST